jgi:hypothetical protein
MMYFCNKEFHSNKTPPQATLEQVQALDVLCLRPEELELAFLTPGLLLGLAEGRAACRSLDLKDLELGVVVQPGIFGTALASVERLDISRSGTPAVHLAALLQALQAGGRLQELRAERLLRLRELPAAALGPGLARLTVLTLGGCRLFGQQYTAIFTAMKERGNYPRHLSLVGETKLADVAAAVLVPALASVVVLDISDTLYIPSRAFPRTALNSTWSMLFH